MSDFPAVPSLEALQAQEAALVAAGKPLPTEAELRADFIALLCQHSITQSAVCALAGLSSSALSLWKSGKPVAHPAAVRAAVWWFLRTVRDKPGALAAAVRQSQPPSAVAHSSGGGHGRSASKSPRRPGAGRPSKREDSAAALGVGGVPPAPQRLTAEQAAAMTPAQKQQYLATVIARWAAGIIKQRRLEAEGDAASVVSAASSGSTGRGAASSSAGKGAAAAAATSGGGSSGLGTCRARRWVWAAPASTAAASSPSSAGEEDDGAASSSSSSSAPPVLVRRWSRINAILEVRRGVLALPLANALGLAPCTPVPGAVSGVHVLVQLSKKASASGSGVRLPFGMTPEAAKTAAVAAGLDKATAAAVTSWTPLAEAAPARVPAVVPLTHDWVDAEDVDASELLLQYFDVRGQEPEAVLPAAVAKRLRRSVAARRVQVERRNSIGGPSVGGSTSSGGSGSGRPSTPEPPAAAAAAAAAPITEAAAVGRVAAPGSASRKSPLSQARASASTAAAPSAPLPTVVAPLVTTVASFAVPQPAVIGAGRGKGLSATPHASAAAAQPPSQPLPQLAALVPSLPPLPPPTAAARFTVAGVPIAGKGVQLTGPEVLPPLPMASGVSAQSDDAWLALGRRPFAGDSLVATGGAASSSSSAPNTIPSNVGYWPGVTMGSETDTFLSRATSSLPPPRPLSEALDLADFYPTYATASAPPHLAVAPSGVGAAAAVAPRPHTLVLLSAPPVPPLAGTKRPREEDGGGGDALEALH